MTVTFNPKTLDMFRNAQFESTRSIANLDGASGLKSNKTLGIWRLFRSNKTTEANNAVRAELLKSLGQSFGLSGMSEKNGRVTFSKEFMTKLEKILGADVLKVGIPAGLVVADVVHGLAAGQRDGGGPEGIVRAGHQAKRILALRGFPKNSCKKYSKISLTWDYSLLRKKALISLRTTYSLPEPS